MILQDDETMIEIMQHFDLTRWQIRRLQRLRDRLTERPLGPEFATTEALRLSFGRHLYATGRISEYPRAE